MSYSYDQSFISYTAGSSEYSARQIIPYLREIAPVGSVLDVGCAAGTWLRIWREMGVADIQGLDGDYISPSALEIPQKCFTAVDLAVPVTLDRTFDIVQSLEVAEHIAPEASANFVQTIVQHSAGYIAFSAAVPGQGGEYHINERPLEFWRDLFRQHEYHAFDFVRPRIQNDHKISFWYRFNILIYVHESRISTLPESVRQTRLPDGDAISDFSPPLFRIRKAAVKLLPYPVQHQLARLKARLQ
ncbi:class I SAM-dependent methyltransferase [Microvirga sp. BT689]|uniref:class I SAM-dependent methyltransferase n=1 Tax=Microvirga arvi TaxID=2778731 RepID=UPI00194F79C6|nr:class I SAM-dependent methyltransferase [Microvirga arvi]MBM6583767.1 class I SAM-dependent methyltransferase [Microvirga arvi]